MENILLKAKHWQLFLINYILPTIILIAYINIQLYRANNHFQDFLKEFSTTTIFFFSLIMICYSVRFFLFWLTVTNFQKNIPINIRSKTKIFKISFFIPIVYLSSSCIFFTYLTNKMIEYNRSIEGNLIKEILDKMINNEFKLDYINKFIQYIFPLHLLSIVAVLYVYYFIAKTIKTAELNKHVKFNDFIGELFMLIFYPIGIWILQPTINKIYKTNNTKQIYDRTKQYKK